MSLHKLIGEGGEAEGRRVRERERESDHFAVRWPFHNAIHIYPIFDIYLCIHV